MNLLLPVVLVVLCAPDGVDPEPLPVKEEGLGLAKRYPRDAGIEQDPRVVLHESFEADDLQRRWDDVKKHPGQLTYATTQDSVHMGRRALRVAYTRGDNSGGHLYKMLEQGRERLFFRFYVKFPQDHGYVHHFVHLTGYEPGTRWPQGGAGERPKGSERFSTGIDVFGDWGRIPPPGRWGFYSYWCEMKGSPDGKFWGNEPQGVKPIPVATDAWICVELMVKVNTVGEDGPLRDGEQAFWIDGKCAGRWGGYMWRKDGKLLINGVWLLYYMTDDAVRRSKGQPKDEHVLFDDLVVATEYVGPMKTKE